MEPSRKHLFMQVGFCGALVLLAVGIIAAGAVSVQRLGDVQDDRPLTHPEDQAAQGSAAVVALGCVVFALAGVAMSLAAVRMANAPKMVRAGYETF